MAKRARPRVAVRPIDSWSEFVDIIQGWPGFRNWCFRGQGKADWFLQPSLARHIEVSKVSPQAWRLQEERIRRIFERKSHLFISDRPSNDELEWLALMQHYGVPTRLLDWSRSPLVAAYFATESCQSHKERRPLADACVWALAPGKLNEMNVREGLIYPLNARSLRQHLKPAFVEPRGEPEPDAVAAAVPFETDLRMVIQQGFQSRQISAGHGICRCFKC